MTDTYDPVVGLVVTVGEQLHRLAGREAFALHALVDVGAGGITPLEYPAPRWSDYVFKLRRRGIVVETIDETHGGAFRGSHARYVLRTPVTVVNITRQSERRRGVAA